MIMKISFESVGHISVRGMAAQPAHAPDRAMCDQKGLLMEYYET